MINNWFNFLNSTSWSDGTQTYDMSSSSGDPPMKNRLNSYIIESPLGRQHTNSSCIVPKTKYVSYNLK